MGDPMGHPISLRVGHVLVSSTTVAHLDVYTLISLLLLDVIIKIVLLIVGEMRPIRELNSSVGCLYSVTSWASKLEAF